MSFKLSQRLFRSLLFFLLLIGIAGCGGKSGGTAVAIPEPFDGGQISDGSFEFGSDQWFGNAANFQPEPGNEENTVNFADVTVAGAPFNVNLSQVTPIIQGQRYSLSFRGRTTAVENAEFDGVQAARTANTRTIFAGIGLNEEPFTNTSQEVTLTTEFQTFTLTLDATSFGAENSRILFDMGADTGVVILDDVNLTLVGDIPPPSDFDSGSLVNGDFEAEGGWIGNAFNIVEIDGNRVNSADIETAGEPFAVNLSQVVAIEQGRDFRLTFRARTDGSRTLLAGIGLNEGDFANDSREVTLSSEWQTFELELSSANFGSANSRVLFDMGAETGLVLIDDVVLEVLSDGAPSGPVDPVEPGAELLNNGGFEQGTDFWIGNAANVTDELLGFAGTLGNFANVETAGQPFAVNLSQVVPISQGATYTLTFTALTDAPRSIIAGIGLNEEPFTNSSQTVDLTTEFTTFTLTLTAEEFGGANSRVLFDMGAETGVVILDNVSLVLVEGGAPIEPTDPIEPVEPTDPPVVTPPTTGSFDDGLLTNGDFEAGVSPWIGIAANVTEELLGFNASRANFANVETAGDAFNVNLSQVVAITQGDTYTLTFKAKSDGNRTMLAGIGLNEEPFTNNSQLVNLTPDFQTYTLTLAATDFGGANSRVLFDMGADTGVVIIDEVSLTNNGSSTPVVPVDPVDPPVVTPPTTVPFDDGLLTNGDFEAGVSPWIGIAANVTEELLGFNASRANFANVETAGEAFNVNLSQVVAITQGETYTLMFKAKSDGNRSMLAGIGLNEEPFTNNSQLVNLTPDFQTYTLTLAATDFGGANSRVLFDMGADTGVVIIDEVSLVQNSSTSPPAANTQVDLPVNFDEAGIDYTLTDFGGNSSSLVVDPTDANNMVVSTVRAANAAVYAGTTIGLPNDSPATDQGFASVIPFTATATTMSVRVYSPAAGIPVRFKVERADDNTITAETETLTTVANQWETLVFDLSDVADGTAAFSPTAGYDKATIFFKFGTDGATAGEKTFLWDDVSFGGIAVAPSTPPPVSFDDGLLTNGDFEAGATSWINVVNVIDDGGNMVNFADVAVAGNPFAVNLSQVVPITQGNTYEISFKAKSDRNRTIIAGIGLNGGDFSNTAEVVNLTTELQTFTLTQTATFGDANSRVLFDMGAEVGQVTLDDVALFDVTPVAPPVVISQVDLPVDFDAADINYTLTDFGGNNSALADDPTDASNTVVRTVRSADAAVYAGTTIGLPNNAPAADQGFASVIPFTASATTMSVRVYSPAEGIVVRLKVERSDNAGISAEAETSTTVANQWETLVFDLSDVVGGTAAFDATAGYDKATIFFKFGTDGATAGEKIFFWDDVAFGGSVTPPTPLPDSNAVNLPVNFEAANVEYNLTDFGGAGSSLVVDPADANNTVVSTSKGPGAALYAGTTIGGSVGFATPIPFTASATTMSVRVFSPDAGIPVRLKVERSDNAGITAETEAVTTVANQWETLVFNLSNVATGTAAFDAAAGYNKASIFFNFGTTGDVAGDKTYLWDDLSFGG